jgi:hypothetical protein
VMVMVMVMVMVHTHRWSTMSMRPLSGISSMEGYLRVCHMGSVQCWRVAVMVFRSNGYGVRE